MFRRGEPVPFAFIAETDRFRSNVAAPPRGARTPRQTAGGVLTGMTVVAGLVGSLLLGLPALDPGQHRSGDGRSSAEQGR